MSGLTSEIYDINIQALKESYPEITLDDLTFLGEVLVEDCKNDQKTLKVNIGGKYKYAHSKYDPVKEAQKLKEKIEIKRNSKIIIYGIGFAYHIEELLKDCGDYNRIYIVEPNYDIFSKLIEVRDISGLLNDTRVRIIFGEADKTTGKLFYDLISWHDFDNIIYTNLPIYLEMYPEKYLEFMRAFRNGFSKIGVDKSTALYFLDTWHELSYDNLKYLNDSINYMGFMDAFKGVPCVLVSAGPSLNKNAHLLKEIKGKFPILCVYTAYKVLRKLGIEPDFIISLDSGQTHMESDEERKVPVNVPLFCESISDKSLLERHTGYKMFMASSCSPLICQVFTELKKTYKNMLAGGSVACTALDLLVLMGGNPIVFIGQDLAFTGGRTHADGTFYDGNNGLKAEKKYMVTEDINGDDVPVDDVFLSFKIWFDHYIAERNDKMNFIDATEGGAKILGTEIMTFRDAIDRNIDKSVDVEKKLNEIFTNNPLFIGDERFIFLDRLKEMENAFDFIVEELNKGIKICKKLLKIYERNEHRTKKGTVEKCLAELNDIDKRLRKKISAFNAVTLLFSKIQNELSNFDNEKKFSDELYILNKNLMLYSNLKRLIEYSKPNFSEAVEEFAQTIGAEEI